MRRSELALLGLALTLASAAGSSAIAISVLSRHTALTADPNTPEWKGAPAIAADNDPMGSVVPHNATEIRSRWTRDNLYILFICHFDQLFAKPNPVTTNETNHLWEWDVAEAFIGSDMVNIDRYKEFEISPHGEWVDLDINLKHSLPEGGWLWNSGFTAKTRIDEQNKVWYGEMRIPFRSIESQAPAAGQRFRVNFYRMQGPPPDRKMIAWQPTHKKNYHVPEAFGTLELK
jgi:hypothetical protein